jgi:hypothetical protein
MLEQSATLDDDRTNIRHNKVNRRNVAAMLAPISLENHEVPIAAAERESIMILGDDSAPKRNILVTELCSENEKTIPKPENEEHACKPDGKPSGDADSGGNHPV